MRNDTRPLSMPDGIRGKHLLIALSGGADSVALLCLLAEKRNAFGLKLTCAHMDHGIRRESGDDALFCEALCHKMDVAFHSVRMDVPSAAAETGEGLETCARRLRYAWLRRIKDEVGADYIALAHHMDDQAETVLMHLFRGAGPEGAAGMRVISGDLFRPLLDIRKQDIVAYLSEKGIDWREDITNQIDDNPRNHIRLNAIPAIEKSYPQAVSALARFAKANAVESDFMARLTDAYMAENLVSGPFGRLLKLKDGWESAIVRRAVRRICGPDLDHDKLGEIMAIAEKGKGKTDISSEIFLECGRLGLYFLPKTPVQIPVAELSTAGETIITGFCRMDAKDAPPLPVRDDPMRQVLLKDALTGAVIRTRRDGDRIRPLGSGEKLLSDYFTDKKIDRPLRDHIPLVAVGQNILWAAGIGISSDAAIRSDTDECVMLTCKDLFSIDKRN